jgi:formylglycine-generating enzyme required for sulfatase activity
MVSVAGGVFQMGCVSGRDDSSCNTNNETAHWVQVNSFKIGVYAVTQALWKEVMDDLPADLKSSSNSIYLGDDKPVIFVSWEDIAGIGGFLEKLRDKTGRYYRLPTEAEWEYAARGCNAGVCESFQYSGSDTIEDVAWYMSNRPKASPQPVGGKSPNGLGLYDMSGNVWEWCYDWYDQYYGADSSSVLSSTTQAAPILTPTGASSGSVRVHRGGSWLYGTISCRVATRGSYTPSIRSDYRGFRLV